MSTPTPLLDLFRRGQASRELRALVAEGVLAPRAHEQLEILVHLSEDADPSVRSAADRTLGRIPQSALAAFLARSDVSGAMRQFFAKRGVSPADTPAAEAEAPLVDAEPAGVEVPETPAHAPPEGVAQQIARMGLTERLKAAMRGTREARAILIRDPNKVVAASVLSSPRLTESEVENFARMTNVSEDVLRTIGSHRGWLRNYGVVVGLTKNPKTPLTLSLGLMARLNDRDITALSVDRNVPETLRVAARRKAVDLTSRR